MAKPSLTLLGGFELRRGDGHAVRLPVKKAEALLAYLALHPAHPLPRDTLAALLWGERTDEQARGSLRYTLGVLRKALAPGPALVAEGHAVGLDGAAIEVDALAFEALVEEGTPAALERAADLYRGDLLEGAAVTEPPFEEWLIAERERLRELVIEALARLLAHHGTAGQTERAVSIGD